MIDNCDMNLFDPENMEIKPGKIDLFIPVGSKMTVSASVDSVYCIGLRTSDRDVNLKMSREQVVKLARGILFLLGEERPQGDLISRKALKKTIEQGEGISWDSYGKDDLCVRKKYIDNAPTVDLKDIYQEGHYDGYLEGYTKAINEERPQGDLISRSEAEKLGATCLARRNENGQLEAIISLDNAPTIIWCSETSDGLPLMDLRPRPQGEWITDDFHNTICNKCGGIRRDNRVEYIAFCNKCGADMKGGAE